MRTILRFRLQLFCILGVLLISNSFPAFSSDKTGIQEGRGMQSQSFEINVDLLNIYGGVIKDVSVFGDYAFLAVGPRMIVMDITEPWDPKIIFKSVWLPDTINALVAYGNYVYMSAGEAGLLIFDISDPYEPFILSSFSEGTEALDLALQGQFVYLSDPSGLYIIDISAPHSPTLAGFLAKYFVKIKVSGDYLYGHAWNYLHIINISDPASVYEVGSVGPGGGKFSGFDDLEVHGSYVYVTNRWMSELFVYDMSEPHNPVEYIYYPQNGAVGPIIPDGNILYAYQYDTILVIDNTDPGNIIELKTIPINDSLLGFRIRGNLLFGYSINSLYIWDKSNRLDLLEIADYQYGEKYSYGGLIEVEDNLVYLRGDQELFAIDFSTPQFPHILGSHHLTDSPDIRVYGQRAYILDYPGEGQWDRKILEIVDFSNPRNPRLIGSYDGIDPALYLYLVDDKFVYLSGTDHNQALGEPVTVVEIWDIVVPAEIHQVSTYSLQGSGWLITAVDNYMYISINSQIDDLQMGLYIVDISELSNPQLRSIYHDDPFIENIVVKSPYVYVFHNEMMDILDLSNPEKPVKVRTYATQYVYDAEAWGDYLYIVTGWLHTLTIYDIGDPVSPQEIGYYSQKGDYNTVKVSDQHIFIDNIAGGLGVLWFAPPVTAKISTAGGDLFSPMDKTHYIFSPETFNETVTVTHTILNPIDNFPPLDMASSTNHAFDVTAVSLISGLPVQPSSAYTLTIDYLDSEIGPVDESSLSLYYKAGDEWLKESSSSVDIGLNKVTAHPVHFSQWALLGETFKVFLPMGFLR